MIQNFLKTFLNWWEQQRHWNQDLQILNNRTLIRLSGKTRPVCGRSYGHSPKSLSFTNTITNLVLSWPTGLCGGKYVHMQICMYIHTYMYYVSEIINDRQLYNISESNMMKIIASIEKDFAKNTKWIPTKQNNNRNRFEMLSPWSIENIIYVYLL